MTRSKLSPPVLHVESQLFPSLCWNQVPTFPLLTATESQLFLYILRSGPNFPPLHFNRGPTFSHYSMIRFPFFPLYCDRVSAFPLVPKSGPNSSPPPCTAIESQLFPLYYNQVPVSPLYTAIESQLFHLYYEQVPIPPLFSAI